MKTSRILDTRLWPWLMLFALLTAGCAEREPTGKPDAPQAGDAVGPKVFVGTIHTMDTANPTATALAVDARGLITAIGSEEEALAVAGDDAKVVRLEAGQVMLPGFIDAHQHVMGLVMMHSGLVSVMSPCLPGPYASGTPSDCDNYIEGTFEAITTRDPNVDQGDLFLLGIGLDPSRQAYSASKSSAEFKALPMDDIEKSLAKDRPVLIIDQSGHFGYVNKAAFRALRQVLSPECTDSSAACENWPPELPPGAIWNTRSGEHPTGGDLDQYTGLLTEIGGYTPFFDAVSQTTLSQLLKSPQSYVEATSGGATGTLDAFREAGLTTIVSMAQSDGALLATRIIAELPRSGTRMLQVVTPELADGPTLEGSPIPPACDPHADADCRLPRDLGVNGIKTIADGSTQGCTAALRDPILYLESSECQDAEGHLNFEGDYLHDQLEPFWRSDAWRFETHANGNRAIEMVLGVYERLHGEHPSERTATLIHATVGEQKLWQQAAALSTGEATGTPLGLHFSHLIGHVAYWGGVFQRQLGPEHAADIDATGFDLKYDIPFSLHSDGPVSIPVPLWFVQQAVTRQAWAYPDLDAAPIILGGGGDEVDHRVEVLDALRAVTINTAREKGLDAWLGSLEVGKVADLVVLDADPFDVPPSEIAAIEVAATYLGGEPTAPE